MIYSAWRNQYTKWIMTRVPHRKIAVFYDGKVRSGIASAHLSYPARMAEKLFRLNGRSTAQ